MQNLVDTLYVNKIQQIYRILLNSLQDQAR